MKKLSGVNKGFVIVLLVLMVALIALSIIETMGYPLIYTHVTLLGTGVLVLVLLVWAAVAIFRRFSSRMSRIIAGTVLGLVVAFVGMMGLTYLLTYAQLAMLQPYATISSPAGEKVAIMYTVDTGFVDEESLRAAEARMDARKAQLDAEAAAAGEVVTETTDETGVVDYPSEAYGFVYAAYPRVMGLFIDATADSQGLIYRGSASEAEIKFEWTDDNTVRFYLENPEPGDEGEIVLTLD